MASPSAESDDKDTCPLCTPDIKLLRREDWVECEACNTWYHWRCAGNGGDVRRLAKWYVHPELDLGGSAC